tara:strand:- start:813 stop:1304 length:492 start_codon:yes stop_codon:yes gene_type:complete
MNALHALLDSYVFRRSAEEESGMELLSAKIRTCAQVSISSFLGTFGFQTHVEYMPHHVEKEIKKVLSSQLGKEVSVRNGIELPCNTADVLPNSLYATYWFSKEVSSDTHAIRLHRSPPIEVTSHAKEHFFFQIFSCPIQGGEVEESVLKNEHCILRYQFEVIS